MDSTVKAKDVMADRGQSISSVAEETFAAAEEISASAQELSASTEEIASSTEEILKVAKRFEEQVGKFYHLLGFPDYIRIRTIFVIKTQCLESNSSFFQIG
ncbi:MAG: methyl-accepting chemotaxis protein [Tepidanaerobacteraceae bacterium]|nr:methyl-accepting chemotaxis protein [Tepidanaerobacteraceae bacterium]